MGFFKRLGESYKKKLAIRKHRKMWRWLAEHPDKGKWEYLKLYNSKGAEIESCFACTYAERLAHDADDDWCRHCPLDWGGRDCRNFDSLFMDWLNSIEPEERAILAMRIAKLPERK